MKPRASLRRLQHLQPMRERGAEVIVVDGGSSDGSAALAAPVRGSRRRCTARPRGADERRRRRRARRRAAVSACGLPAAGRRGPPDSRRARGASGKSWGRFDVALDGTHPLLRLVAAMMNLRSRLTGIATGDQGLFMRRALLRRRERFSADSADGRHRHVAAAQNARPRRCACANAWSHRRGAGKSAACSPPSC